MFKVIAIVCLLGSNCFYLVETNKATYNTIEECKVVANQKYLIINEGLSKAYPNEVESIRVYCESLHDKL